MESDEFSDEFSKEGEESIYVTSNSPKGAIFLTTACEKRHIEGSEHEKKTPLTHRLLLL
jgi:hypothetical protein